MSEASMLSSPMALMKLRRFAPSTAGRLRRKEYFIAKVRSRPVAMPAVMVVPERESPGMVATHWHRPMVRASRKRMLRSVRVPGAILSETKSIQPVSSSAAPMNGVM